MKSSQARFTVFVFLQICTLAILLLFYFKKGDSTHASSDLESSPFYQAALKLEGAGVSRQAILYYQKALEGNAQKGQVFYNLAILQESEGRYEEALSSLYMVELGDASAATKEQAGKKIVILLEKLGKSRASEMALEERTKLAPSKSESASKNKPQEVVAEIDQDAITLSEFTAYYDSLPETVKKEFSSKEKKLVLLERLVAEKVLLKKAMKLDLSNDPEYRKRTTEIERQLLLEILLQKELLTKLTMEANDLKNFYQLHKDQYVDDKKKPLPFDQVKTRVEADYRQEKMQSLYQSYMQNLIKDQNIKLHGERLL